MQFTWKAFLYKALDFLKQHTCTDSSTLSTSPSVLELRRQLQTSGGVSEDKTTTVPDSWTNRYDKSRSQAQQIGVHVAWKRMQCLVYDVGAWL